MKHLISLLLLVSAALSVAPVRAAQTPQTLEYEAFCKIADVQDRRAAFVATSAENRAVLVRTQMERWRDANRPRLNVMQLEALANLVALITPDTYGAGPKADEARAKARPWAEAQRQLFTPDELEAMQPTGPCIDKNAPQSLPGPRPIDALLEVPRLDPNVRIASLKRDATLISVVMDTLRSVTRLTVQYDQSVPELNKTCTVNLVNASLEETLDTVLRANGIAFTVLGPKQVLVYSDTPTNRERYGWSVRAFQIMNADPAALTSLLYRQTTSAPGIRPIIVVAASPARTINVRATGEKMAVIAKLIADNDKR